MLKLSLPRLDVWDEKTEQFKTIGGVEVELEHSLYTVSLWEAKWKKPFADFKGLERKELLDYICNFMCQTEDVPSTAWLTLNQDHINKITAYLSDRACATTINNRSPGSKGKKGETMTAELIYFYMAQFGIPFECDRWHLNRLMMLIDVAAIKNSPQKKMSRKESARMQGEINRRRRAASGK